ncbi:GerMN domain-containing protein [Sutcliffiella deserti]|uniref:GerMN domain-containing protein n=1 Tax=Sutcliffiella deserti TaxID=2875501 RepID=UPI001CBE293E|nr:GerMN domain-containing protein [Sutcliffiella deserti]
MRRKQRIEEDQLEKVLRQMPIIKDNRDPKQIYREVEMRLNKKPRQFKVMPALALAAAVLIFAMITPLFFQNMSSQDSTMNDSAVENRSGEEMEQMDGDDSRGGDGMAGIQSFEATEDKESDGTSEEDTTFKTNELVAFDNNSTFVVTNVNEDTEYVITIGATADMTDIDPEPFTVPLSIVVPKDKEDSYIAALERIRYELNYSDLGVISPFINEGATLTEGKDNTGKPKAILEVGTTFAGLSSLQNTMMSDELYETFRTYYSSYEFTTNGSKENVQVGNLLYNEPVVVKRENARAYYKYQAFEHSPVFLVPSRTDYQTFEEALESMYKGAEHFKGSQDVEASIPENMVVESITADKVEPSVVIISLSQESSLENTEENIFALEAIMMTAKEFGFEQVLFKTSEGGMIGNIQLNEPIDVPLSANPIPYQY